MLIKTSYANENKLFFGILHLGTAVLTNKMPTLASDKKQSICDWGSVRDILSRLGDKWTLKILIALSNHRLRFNELFRALDGISQRMLIVALRNLERDGLVNRIGYPTVPPRVEYELSTRGQSLCETLVPLRDWALEHRPEIIESRENFDLEHGRD